MFGDAQPEQALAALDEDGLFVYCIVCHAIGFVTPGSGGAAVDRQEWRPIACLFTPGCRGVVHPEALN
jgi:hypothetical protein